MTKHGDCTRDKVHPLYDAWRNIKRRCYGNYTNSKYYKNYGGRGITVCAEWLSSYSAFYSWAISNGWEPGLTIERKNNDGNYDSSNCCWVTRSVQLRNRRNNRYVTYNGITKPAIDWACEIGINSRTFTKRLNNWSDIERVFNEPIHSECARN